MLLTCLEVVICSVAETAVSRDLYGLSGMPSEYGAYKGDW